MIYGILKIKILNTFYMPTNTSISEVADAFESFNVGNVVTDQVADFKNLLGSIYLVSSFVYFVLAIGVLLFIIEYVINIIHYQKDKEKRNFFKKRLIVAIFIELFFSILYFFVYQYITFARMGGLVG